MGFEPLEDTLPLPQIVRTMKSITVPSHGRSVSVHCNSSSSNVDGSGKPSIPAREQEASAGSSGSSDEICDRSPRDRVWSEVTYLLGSLDRIKEQISNGSDWDQCEIDWLHERYQLCRQQAMHYVLCLNLSQVLTTVSYPGEQLTYLQLAERVVTGCSRSELYEAIEQIGLRPGEQVYFKAQTDALPLERAEQILLSMIGDAGYVLAKDFNAQLNLPVNSATYKHIKKCLADEGWVWRSKKINGIVSKVITR